MLRCARALCLAAALAACRGAVAAPASSSGGEVPSVVAARAATLGDPAPGLAREAPRRRNPDLDHSATPCFLGTEAPLFTRAPRRRGGLVTTLRASIRIDREPVVVAPGTTLRLEAAIENVRPRPIVLSRSIVARLSSLAVRGVADEWAEHVRSPSALTPGAALAPEAVLRLCARVEIPARPIAAAPAGELGRAYTIEWPTLPSAGEPPSLEIVVRDPPDRAAIAREPESWGGIIRVRLAPGASIATIARETGVRVASGTALDDGADRDRLLVEAPPDRRVLDTAIALSARDDVLYASPVLVGDRGTEGDRAHGPGSAR